MVEKISLGATPKENITLLAALRWVLLYFAVATSEGAGEEKTVVKHKGRIFF